MPRTLDRGGSTLNAGFLDAALGSRSLSVQWSVRIVDVQGDWSSSTLWERHEIQPSAILNRNRNLSLDEGPMRLSLTLLADQLPSTVPVKQGHRLEVDRVIGPTPPNEWPYFTGVITAVDVGQALQDGAIVKTYEVQALGVLQLTQAFRVNTISGNPTVTQRAFSRVTGVCQRVRIRRDVVLGAGGVEFAPGGVYYGLDDATYGLQIDDDSAFGSPYTGGGTHYTLSTVATPPATVTWAGGTNPAEPRYFQFWVPVFFGLLLGPTTYGDTPPTFFRLPYGRDPFDLFQTEVSAWDAGTKELTCKDLNFVKNSLLDSSQGEYVTFTDSDGTEDTEKISSVNTTTGVITLVNAPSFTPAAGDPVRISTVEMFPALDPFGYRQSGDLYHPPRIFGNTGTTVNESPFAAGDTTLTVGDGTKFRVGQFILIESEILRVTAIATNDLTVVRGVEDTTDASHLIATAIFGEYPRGRFIYSPDQGFYQSRGKASYATTDEAKARFTTVNETLANQIETVIKDLLSTELDIFAAADITTAKTGAYIKNINLFDRSLADILREFKEAALPPNAYILDERDGKISIQPYVQDTTPDIYLQGPSAIQQEDAPEPPTAICVVGTFPAVNKAAEWFSNATGMSNADRIIDGSGDGESAQTAAGTPGEVRFVIPAQTPIEAFPLVDSVEISGRGYFTVSVEATTVDRVILRDWFYRPIGITSTSGSSATITGDELARAMTEVGSIGSTQITLVVVLNALDDSGTAATGGISEVKIHVVRQNAWTAKLTDDSTNENTYDSAIPSAGGGAPASWAPSDTSTFGTFYWQPNYTKRESFRFAPDAHLKRVLAKDAAARGDQKHKTEIVELPGLSVQECRDYAERYLDEYTRRATQYRIRAILDDRIERGDTVGVPFPDGTNKNLFVLAISDGGGVDEIEAEYLMIDYS